MATQQSTVDALLQQLAAAGSLTARKMFGEFCLYLDGKPVGLVCDDRLFVKPTAAGQALGLHEAEAAPFPQARPHLLITADRLDRWDGREAVCELLRATCDALPAPRPRKPRRAPRWPEA